MQENLLVSFTRREDGRTFSFMAHDISLHRRLPIPYVFHLLLLEVNWQFLKASTLLREFIRESDKRSSLALGLWRLPHGDRWREFHTHRWKHFRCSRNLSGFCFHLVNFHLPVTHTSRLEGVYSNWNCHRQTPPHALSIYTHLKTDMIIMKYRAFQLRLYSWVKAFKVKLRWECVIRIEQAWRTIFKVQLTL